MPELGTATTAWTALQEFVSRHFSQPDLHALEIAFCVYVSHSFLNDDPVWLFVLGPPGTGKTGIIIACLSALPRTTVLSDLTATTFLSGFGRGSKGYSLLHQIAPVDSPHGVILFKDFTSFLAKRDDARKEIASQLREIHDGRYVRAVGAQRKPVEWTGKITVIAVCTPAIERAWAVNRELGDRFVTIRWPRSNGIELGAHAARQIGREKAIKDGLKTLSGRVFEGLKAAGPPSEELIMKAAHIAEYAAQLRTTVYRDSWGPRDIGAVSEPEGPTRFTKALCQLARARACLYHRTVPTMDDLLAVRRVITESVPRNRALITHHMGGCGKVRGGELELKTGIPTGTIYREIEELIAMGLVRVVGQDSMGNLYSLAPEFEALQTEALC